MTQAEVNAPIGEFICMDYHSKTGTLPLFLASKWFISIFNSLLLNRHEMTTKYYKYDNQQHQMMTNANLNLTLAALTVCNCQAAARATS